MNQDYAFSPQVFRIAYCKPFSQSNMQECRVICREFVVAVKEHCPQFLKKVKVHLLLHLPDNMHDFGPTSAFNTERYTKHIHVMNMSKVDHVSCTFFRCETFNSLIRARNIFANRLAPSRDIAQGFSAIEHLRFICSGGSLSESAR